MFTKETETLYNKRWDESFEGIIFELIVHNLGELSAENSILALIPFILPKEGEITSCPFHTTTQRKRRFLCWRLLLC